MDPLFRLPDAVRHDPAIDRWFAERASGLGELVEGWYERMRACGDDVCEIMHDGYPTACVGDAAFAYVGVFKAHANVGFFWGAELADPAGLLEGAGKRMRHVKLRPRASIDHAALAALIDAAYADMKARLGDA